MEKEERVHLAIKAKSMKNFIQKYPEAPLDIIFLNVWYFTIQPEDLPEKYKYMYNLTKHIPSTIRRTLTRDITNGIDCEKKVQALVKIYGDI